jgi:hypothetical protein
MALYLFHLRCYKTCNYYFVRRIDISIIQLRSVEGESCNYLKYLVTCRMWEDNFESSSTRNRILRCKINLTNYICGQRATFCERIIKVTYSTKQRCSSFQGLDF